jgi:hypothetical protein
MNLCLFLQQRRLYNLDPRKKHEGRKQTKNLPFGGNVPEDLLFVF